MTNTERKQLIQNAISEYHQAKATGDFEKIAQAVNNMDNVYIAVVLHGVEGVETLRQLILSAKAEKITPAKSLTPLFIPML